MRHKITISFSILCFLSANCVLLIYCLGAAPVLAYSAKEHCNQRALFLRIESDLKQGKFKLFQQYAKLLTSYPLYPYLEYAALTKNINKVNLRELNLFLSRYKHSPIAENLHKTWLAYQAKQRRWQNFLDSFAAGSNHALALDASYNAELRCNYLWAHYQVHHDNAVFQYVAELWLEGKSRPKACDPLFAAWENAGLLSKDLLWQRIKLAIENKESSLARYLSKKLPQKDANLVELWLRINDNPKLISQTTNFTSKHPAIADILVHGIKKIAAKDPDFAIKIWLKIADKHAFSQTHWLLVVKSIGISLAKDQHPNADQWLAKIPRELLDQTVVDVRIRLALQRKDWHSIIELCEQLPAELAQNEKTQYWQARALEMLNNTGKSRSLLENISSNRSYYSFLASAKLSKTFNFNNTAIPIHESDLVTISNHPGVARAIELAQLNRQPQANLEWRAALQTMSNKDKEAAAILAAQLKQPNWAIVALANSDSKNDLALRFPRSYSSHVFQQAKRNKLDPALIFAITRQESAFIPTARSPAGALGLMQLMPHTGKMIARLDNVTISSYHDFLDVDKNIRLGSKYFRMMLDKYQQNPVLAAAAYNAGPNKVIDWLPNTDMAADSWIDAIPYKETRNYVQNVLTYTVIYQQLLNSTPELARHMPVIPRKDKILKSENRRSVK